MTPEVYIVPGQRQYLRTAESSAKGEKNSPEIREIGTHKLSEKPSPLLMRVRVDLG